jgi:hypothetical protein
VSQGRQYKFGAHPGGTGNPYDPEIMRVLKTAYSSEIRCAITAPVAKECRDFGLPVIHNGLLSYWTFVSNFSKNEYGL